MAGILTIAAAVGISLAPAMAHAAGDRAKGRDIARQHCARCHVIGDDNRMGGIGSTPSFPLLRKMTDWRERFANFYDRRPHPVHVRVEGVRRWTDLPPIGVGRLGRETPLGSTSITAKRQSPTWTPPASIRAKRPDLPATAPPGPDNPLGLFAMNLGWRNYVIHGTNKPCGIGRRVSSGRIRLYPEDIERLFDTVDVGTPVMVVDQEFKLGWAVGELYLEIHPPVAEGDYLEEKGWYAPHPVPGLKKRILEAAGEHAAGAKGGLGIRPSGARAGG